MRIPDKLGVGQDPIQIGVNILDKLINDLKSKLPLGKKKKNEDDELDENEDLESGSSHQSDATDSTDISEMADDEDAAENKSLIHKLKSKIQSLKKKQNSSDDIEEDGDESEVDEEALKKKKRSKILQGVIIGGIVVFMASDYIFPPEDEVPAVQLKPRPRPKKPKPVDPTATTTETATETPADTTATTETPTETPAETSVDTTATTETSVDEPLETPVDTTATTETPVEDPVETPVDTTATTETPDESPVDVTSTETSVEETPADDVVATDTTNDSSVGEGSIDSIDGTEAIGESDNLTDQILEDLEKQAKSSEPAQVKKEYVAPPDYEYRGRGLVYNCTGKHWACVDAPSYKTCEDNSSSVKYLNKTIECYPFNVYETTKGCESMQNRMVSSSAKTTFCSE